MSLEVAPAQGARRILLCLSHSIEEYDQLRLFHALGHEVFSIGGYIDPANPHDPKRPSLPEVPHYQELHDAVDSLGTPDNLGAAQAHIPDRVLEWLGADGVIVFHHNLHRLFDQWGRIKAWKDESQDRRVVWRTVGQSVSFNEEQAGPYRREGLEIVRYSPHERAIPGYAGEDALIRFYKDPDEWGGWTGERAEVTQFVQRFYERELWCNRPFFEEATHDLPRSVYGPGSELLQYGLGEQTPDMQKRILQKTRAYAYTGTQPASYTLGLLEAAMTGVPVVSIGPSHMRIFPYGPALFEGHELAWAWSDNPHQARRLLNGLLRLESSAAHASEEQRERIVSGFGVAVVADKWRAFLR